MSTTEQAVEDLLSEQELDGQDLQRRLGRRAGDDRDDRARHRRRARHGRRGERGDSVAAATKSAARAQRGWAAHADGRARRGHHAAPPSCSSATGPRSQAGWCASPERSRRRRSTRSARRSASSNEAASLISHPLEQELPSPIPGRTCTARARADRRRRRDHALELPARARDALARPGARARQRGRAQERPEHAGHRRRDHRARSSRRPGCPSGVLHVFCGGAEVGQALVEDPNVRMISFTGLDGDRPRGRRDRGPRPEAGRARARRQQPAVVLEDADIEAASSAGAWGSFLHQGQICLAVSRHLVHESIAEEYLAALDRAGGPPARRQPGSRARWPSARSSTRSRSSACSGSSTRRSPRAPRSLVGGTRDGLFFPPTVLRDVTPGDGRVQGGDLRPGGARSRRSRPTTRPSSWRTRRSTASRPPFSPEAGSGPTPSQRASSAGMVHVNDQTVNEEPPAPFGGFKCSSNGGHFGGVGQLELWTEWQWLTSREKAGQFPF